MLGKVKPISLGRKLVLDLLHASIPLVVVKRTMEIERLVTARASLAVRPGWSTIIAKAFCIVARDEPCLRTFYLKWPWPHFYEVPKSVAMVAVVRADLDVPVMLKVGSADEFSLADVDAFIQRGKHSPAEEVPSLRRMLRIARLPLPLRRLLWSIGLNVGRQRANYFGTFAITSLASLDVETIVARTPGPAFITYGAIRPDHTMELLFHWDHRIYDGFQVARALRRLEDVLNTDIADEMLANEQLKSPSVTQNAT